MDSPCRPLVSVCCITYNHRPYIAQAIESFLMQETDFPFEIIIHDDASTDGTAEIVREYVGANPNLIRTILQTENQYSKGENISSKTFAVANGRYIALCEGDDYWTDPRKLALQAEFLEQNHDCVMCYGNVSLVDEAGRILQRHRIPDEQCRRLAPEELIKGSHVTPTSTVMFRNLPFLRHPPPEFNRVLNGDRFLVAMLAQHGAAGFLAFKPSIYRQHGGGVYSTLSASQRRAAHLNSYKHILRCIDREYRPVVCDAIAQIYTREISDLRRHNRPPGFLRTVLGLLWFSATCREWRHFPRDMRTCIYHLRRWMWRVEHT